MKMNEQNIIEIEAEEFYRIHGGYNPLLDAIKLLINRPEEIIPIL
ncbi:MAG TPA: hypothetical protein VJ953_10160 [Saprospiraceae bacterium]|nr:hypothetical protein [Saprospiraceae bacterium]